MIRKIAHIVLWVILAGWFTVIMGFVSRSNSELLCGEIRVSISDSSNIGFVTSGEVRSLLARAELNLQGYPVEEIQTRDLEFLLERNPYVENAEIYTDVDGILYIKITQRKPLVRVMPGGTSGFYIDRNGIILPLSEKFSPMVLLLSGKVEVPETLTERGMRCIDSKKSADLEQFMKFAKFVNSHEFWNRQIVQVYRNRKGEYELIPRIGAHQIEFGSMENFDIKLRNLMLLYDQGFDQYGWNTYNKINLKYANQIICTKR